MPRGFTLLELVVVVAVVALLVGVMMTGLAGARRQARTTSCAARLRELGRALHLYATDYEGMAMPLAYWSFEIIGTGPAVYWWGTDDPDGVDHTRGFVWPYLQSPPGAGSVLECPEQPPGSYAPQGAARATTSTYGYNGYYLSPAHTPGWAFQIGHRPWLGLSRVRDPSRTFAFADTLIDVGGGRPRNNALLDPPRLYAGGTWTRNDHPTTAFRHDGAAAAAHVDGHVERYAVRAGWLTSRRFGVGSVGTENDPHYVPDWRDWRGP